MPIAAMTSSPATASMSMPLSLITGHAYEIALGGLALFELVRCVDDGAQEHPGPDHRGRGRGGADRTAARSAAAR